MDRSDSLSGQIRSSALIVFNAPSKVVLTASTISIAPVMAGSFVRTYENAGRLALFLHITKEWRKINEKVYKAKLIKLSVDFSSNEDGSAPAQGPGRTRR
jgi:hypothetical protein